MSNKKSEYTNRLKHFLFSPELYLSIRVIIGGIFIFSGSLKLMDPYKFAMVVYEYGILPDFLINPAAIGLPLIEILAGFGLLFNIILSLEIITGMLLLFICVLWFGILKDLNIDCGCFSADEIREQGSLQHALYRDFVFISLVIFLFISRHINKANKAKLIFLRSK